MIITLTIECVWGLYLREEWKRVMEVDSRSSLCDLHLAIQDAINFDDDHLFDFYIGKNCRDRRIEYHDPLDIGNPFEPIDIFNETFLDQVYPLPKGLKLYYLFDYGDNWIFEIKKTRKKPRDPEPGVEYPRIIEKIGENPVQYPRYDEEEEYED